MHSDQALLEAVQRERNPSLAELEREQAIDVARSERSKHTTNNTLGRFDLEQERDRYIDQIKRGKF